MAPALSKVRAGPWDQTDILLGEIARGKKIVIDADHQDGRKVGKYNPLKPSFCRCS